MNKRFLILAIYGVIYLAMIQLPAQGLNTFADIRFGGWQGTLKNDPYAADYQRTQWMSGAGFGFAIPIANVVEFNLRLGFDGYLMNYRYVDEKSGAKAISNLKLLYGNIRVGLRFQFIRRCYFGIGIALSPRLGAWGTYQSIIFEKIQQKFDSTTYDRNFSQLLMPMTIGPEFEMSYRLGAKSRRPVDMGLQLYLSPMYLVRTTVPTAFYPKMYWLGIHVQIPLSRIDTEISLE